MQFIKRLESFDTVTTVVLVDSEPATINQSAPSISEHIDDVIGVQRTQDDENNP